MSDDERTITFEVTVTEEEARFIMDTPGPDDRFGAFHTGEEKIVEACTKAYEAAPA